MNTNYNDNVAGALKLININGSIYLLGKDAGIYEGGILRLFGGNDAFETYKNSIDGTYDAATVYGEISTIKSTLGIGSEESIVDQIEDLEDSISAAKSVVTKANNETYLDIVETTGTDGNSIYTISTTGIDSAISSAVSTGIAGIVNGAPSTFDTLKEISDWIADNNTGVASILAELGNKATKVTNATNGNFAGLDANGNLTDSGVKASDFQPAGSYKTTQSAYTASGTATDKTVATLTQNANGEIAATFLAIQDASASLHGLMSAAHYNKLNAISVSVSDSTLSITTQAA